jgi:hypothetical protein
MDIIYPEPDINFAGMKRIVIHNVYIAIGHLKATMIFTGLE